jgi:opacity protein-like surface antigen
MKTSKGDGCWLWTGATDKNGYGRTSQTINGRTSMVRAHRAMFEMRFGEIPDGMMVCHRCDNPSCVNPDHLFLGSALANMRDKIAKGRAVYECGERHHAAKINESDVAAIRTAHIGGEAQSALARRYGLGRHRAGLRHAGGSRGWRGPAVRPRQRCHERAGWRGAVKRLLLLAAFALALSIGSQPTEAEPYVKAVTGTQWPQGHSNSDGLEFGSEVGWAAGVAIGDELGLSDVGLPKSDFALQAEIEVLHRADPLHGKNRTCPDVQARHSKQPKCDAHQTADGRDLELTTFAVNLWPGWELSDRFTLYAGGGIGAGFAQALGHTSWAPVYQAGGGVLVWVTDRVGLELAERSVWQDDVKLRGYELEYESHGILASARLEF